MTGIVAAIRAAFSAIGAVFGYFKDRQLINAGKAEERAANAKATIEDIARASGPATDAELDGVRDRFRRS